MSEAFNSNFWKSRLVYVNHVLSVKQWTFSPLTKTLEEEQPRRRPLLLRGLCCAGPRPVAPALTG